MWTDSRLVRAGDLIIVWMTRESLLPLTIEPGKELNGRYGVYRHEELIGIPYGTKVASRNGRGYIHVLRPTPELWTLALPHRTQILYMADIAYITSWLAIKPGSVVIEAGTGSGSFSHSVARTIGPTGHLHSFEYHAERAKKAKLEFSQHGMDDCVTLSHRNVCKDGFGLSDDADAVFLDLPAPWDAVQYAQVALKKDRTTRICCFSPCMEQVLRTVTALNDAGFTGITMFEALVRPQEVSSVTLPSIETAVQKLREAEVSGEERRLRQKENAKIRNKRKRDEAASGPSASAVASETDSPAPPDAKKRKETIADISGASVSEAATGDAENLLDSSLAPQWSVPNGVAATEASLQPPIPSSSLLSPQTSIHQISMAAPFPEVRGHTSYLTFAVLLPYEHVTQNHASGEHSTS